MRFYLQKHHQMVQKLLLGTLSFFATQNLVAQSDVTIIYYIAQEGAEEEEIDAVRVLATNLFNQSESHMFFMPLGNRESMFSEDGPLNAVFDTLAVRDFSYPAINPAADVKKFQSAMNDFERSENEKYLDASSGSIHLHFVIEGSANSSTLEKIQNDILVLNGWTVVSGKLHAQISLSRWIWGEREKRMIETKPLEYE